MLVGVSLSLISRSFCHLNSGNAENIKETEETVFKSKKIAIFNWGHTENGRFTPIVAIVQVRPKATGSGCTVEYGLIMDHNTPNFDKYSSFFVRVLKDIDLGPPKA